MKVIAYSTLREVREPDFPCQVLEVQTRETPGFVSHLNGMIGWACDSGEANMTPILYSVLRHLERTRNQVQMEIRDSDLEHLAQWGRRSNSIYWLADQTLRDPDGAILVDRENDQVNELASVPFPDDARLRNQKNRERLAQRGISVIDTLPPIPGESEVVIRPSDEVAWRSLALFITAVRAESVATDQPISAEQLKAKSPMSFEAMTPNELAFLETDQPDTQQVINFAWRYEALFALQWALGLHDQLKFPDQICDVPRVAETMVDYSDRDLVLHARLRPVDELLDAIDLNGQMLWAARQARIENREPPENLDGGVLSERQHAFNWLIRLGEAPWDDVDTPT
ncbi:hypothetical protein Pla22_19660 [Rubripirellula amarantea]|uniref:DUF4272 domain-containing protein n=1 Tax=Rubripirellula amarantea TaxID=2527999 RepID=A0A5C5WUS9_9BACT|nr:DUF4272 domain-containing protein [Rubripirellula amarantea]TWT54320.1 hypothetical protein Pla22_19660 [Rubripirellula amarantea]